MAQKKLPLVTVVITTKNEEKNIENCLKSIKRQTYPQRKIEIIVVDNNSSDKTKRIALKYTSKVFNKGPERSAQRNYGAQKARGKYYMYLDSDMTFGKGVIKACVEILSKKKELVALYIPEIVQGKNFWSRVRRFERSFYNGTVIDSVRFIRIDAFKKVNGFDETMSGPEDWDFDKKIRQIGKTSIIKAPIFHNETEFNLKTYLSKKMYYSKSFSKYIGKWGENDRDIRKQLGFSYRFIRVFVENSNWKKLLSHPILTIGMYILRFYVGIIYLSRVKRL